MLSDPQNLSALSRRIYESAGFMPQTRLVCNNIFTALNMVQKQLGIVIAHEISHSFDSSGASFDALGNVADWWTPEDKAEGIILACQAKSIGNLVVEA